MLTNIENLDTGISVTLQSKWFLHEDAIWHEVRGQSACLINMDMEGQPALLEAADPAMDNAWPTTPTLSRAHAIPSTPRTPSRVVLGPISNPSNMLLPVPFDTPHCQKTPPTTPQHPSIAEKLWSRISKRVSIDKVIRVTKLIFDHEHFFWQLDMFKKATEGYDTLAIAGTGYEKTMMFRLLAVILNFL